MSRTGWLCGLSPPTAPQTGASQLTFQETGWRWGTGVLVGSGGDLKVRGMGLITCH